MVGQRHQPLGQRAVERARHLPDRVLAVGVEVGAAGVADQQRVAREHEPRLVATRPVGDEVGVMRQCMTGSGDRLDLGVPEYDHLAVSERVMREVDPGTLGQVRGRVRSRDELGEAGDVIGLEVRLEHGDDRHALALRLLDVGIDQVDVGIDYGEALLGLAAQQVGGTGGVVDEQLSEVQGLDKLSSDLLNNNMGRPEKDALFEAIALMGKAFASPRRLELLDLLAQAPRTVDELARASEQATANTSQHLQALHSAGMVTRTREGTKVRYSLAGDEALALWLALRDASVIQLAEVERAAREYLGDDVEAIGRDELISRLGRGDVVLVDVRPSEEFAAGHIEGARSIPLSELRERLAELPADREVVAYCRGPFCAYAHEAVRQLRAGGRPARRLDEGWPEWRLADRGVESVA